MFDKKRGFDVVIANPPYVRMELFKDLKPGLRARYPHVHSDRADLYCYFYACAFQLLAGGGVLSFITSNKFFRAGYGEPLREFLAAKTELRAVIDFGDLPIFKATAYPCIVIARNRQPEKNHYFQTLNVRTEAELPRFSPSANHSITAERLRLAARIPRNVALAGENESHRHTFGQTHRRQNLHGHQERLE